MLSLLNDEVTSPHPPVAGRRSKPMLMEYISFRSIPVIISSWCLGGLLQLGSTASSAATVIGTALKTGVRDCGSTSAGTTLHESEHESSLDTHLPTKSMGEGLRRDRYRGDLDLRGVQALVRYGRGRSRRPGATPASVPGSCGRSIDAPLREAGRCGAPGGAARVVAAVEAGRRFVPRLSRAG